MLPGPHEWKYRLDLWQNPWVLAWYNHIEPWSPQHKMLLKEHLKLYADAGGKYITTYAVHSPWSDNSYRIEGGMIEWVKRKDNTWHFDYNIFDQYVELAMSVGIDKAITVYTLLPNDNRFRYMDEKTGNYVNAKWEPGSAVFNDACGAFLNDLKKHLDKKGWFDKTYLGINESPIEQVLIAIKLIKAQPAKWKITYAGDWHKELSGLLDDYSFVYGYEPDIQGQQRRLTSGQTSTLYVCCHPAKPNTLVFSPPIEGRWISWYTAAMGYDGFLRWAYDAWPEDPVRDARHGSWAAGDCFLVYPGANSCIRFEKLREGIVDYEKMRILRGMATKSTDANVKKMMNEFDAFLKTFVQEKIFKSENLEEQVKKGKDMMDALSEKLSK